MVCSSFSVTRVYITNTPKLECWSTERLFAGQLWDLAGLTHTLGTTGGRRLTLAGATEMTWLCFVGFSSSSRQTQACPCPPHLHGRGWGSKEGKRTAHRQFSIDVTPVSQQPKQLHGQALVTQESTARSRAWLGTREELGSILQPASNDAFALRSL